MEAYGTVDEVNAFVGEAITRLDPAKSADMIEDLLEIQHELFDAGGDLAQVGKEKELQGDGRDGTASGRVDRPIQ